MLVTPRAAPVTVGPLPAGEQLVVTLDALVRGVHFPAHTTVEDVAFKALAVNISDLAAMGAKPLAAQACCESAREDHRWRDAVAASIEQQASREFAVTAAVFRATAPEGRVVVQAMGCVPVGAALTRAGAVPGDRVWVSGTLGDAGAGLAVETGRLAGITPLHRDHLLARLRRPTPRVALGLALRGVATAAIDVSDGIGGDARHVAQRSGVALHIEAARLPLSPALAAAMDDGAARRLAAFAGDDYELLFTAPPERDDRIRHAARSASVVVTAIGRVVAGAGVRLVDASGMPMSGSAWDHFAPNEARAP